MSSSASTVLVLGSAQDGGVPQAGCSCPACRGARSGQQAPRYPACLGLIDHQHAACFLLDATPALPQQLALLASNAPDCRLAGIILSHAHIGHYTGLIQLGREVMDTRALPVFCSPQMADFLRRNAPWRQLVELGNIVLMPFTAELPLQLTDHLTITPHTVPHRAEWSDTHAFTIAGHTRRLFYCPDIDRWQDWSVDVRALIDSVDTALIDGTFFSNDELPGRDMSQIPHPTVSTSIALLSGSRCDVRFTHLNHSNPLLIDPARRTQLQQAGFSLAAEGQLIAL